MSHLPIVFCIVPLLAVSPLFISDIWLRLLSVLLLIAINAFFVTAEFSMVSVRRSRIHQLVEAGDAPAITLQALQHSIDRLLSTTQLGITLSSLALGWIGESTMAVLVATGLTQLPLSDVMRIRVAHSLSIPLAFFLVAYLQIVLGELCPKSVALLYSERLARLLALPVKAIARFFTPFIWILNQSTRLLLRVVGIQYTGQAWLPPVTSEELQLIIATERESTGLEAEERELLNNIFEFGDVTAEEIMVPRTGIVALPEDATFQTLLKEMATTGHSRYPIIGKSLDDVRGIVHFKELAKPLVLGKLSLDTKINPWLHPARFVPEYMPLSELLPLMQRSHLPIVIVVNEFGGTVGLITIQDLVAQIIGNTSELATTDELLVQNLDEQTFLVQAQMNLEELNELLKLDLPLRDDYQTLGGFLLYQLQKVPAIGETLHYQNLEFTVTLAQGPRLQHIRIRRLQPTFTNEHQE
ncbi:hemolysin family protein [Gloeocapsopsis crepidinum]|uniref:hemolysin family protein n=1 Tax=Gloeocapsopsis crepidinum TaxID=693223 RepID=UPI001D133AA8|nr:hemolysin family protein [Gloeocapsopsis crepidinum]